MFMRLRLLGYFHLPKVRLSQPTATKWLVILDFDLDIELKMDTPASPLTKRGEGLSSAIIQPYRNALSDRKFLGALPDQKTPPTHLAFITNHR
jgi:hypothetical protein